MAPTNPTSPMSARPSTGTAVRRPARLVARGVAVSLFVTLLPGVAGAQPLDRQQSVGSLQEQARKVAAELDRLDQQTNALDEQFNDANLQLDRLKAKLTANQAEVDDSRQQLEAKERAAQDYAVQAFVGSTEDETGLLGISDDAATASQRRTYLASRYGDSEAVIDGLVASQKDLAAQEADLKAANAKVDAKVAELDAAKGQLEDTISARRKLYESVKGQLADALVAEQQRLAAEAEAKARAAAEAAAARAAAARRPQAVVVRAAAAPGTGGAGGAATTVVAAPASTNITPPPANAPKAVEVAMAQQGDPYRWAASGPDSFGCSGLVMYAYGAAGVSLPHSSRSLRSMARSISEADLQPGDLIFGGSPVHHVGIYIGNGQMVHAPHSGDVVRVASIYSTSKPVSFGRL